MNCGGECLPSAAASLQPRSSTYRGNFSELSNVLKMMHHSFQEEPDGLRHALAIIPLSAAHIGNHFDHCLLEAVRNVPELAGQEGPWRDAFEPLRMKREYMVTNSEACEDKCIVKGARRTEGEQRDTNTNSLL